MTYRTAGIGTVALFGLLAARSRPPRQQRIG